MYKYLFILAILATCNITFSYATNNTSLETKKLITGICESNISVDDAAQLLEQGADVTYCDEQEDLTPLHAAAKMDRNDLIVLFASKTNDFACQIGGDITPLHFALQHNCLLAANSLIDMCKAKAIAPNEYLEQRAFNENTSDEHETVLHCAAHNGDVEIVTTLIASGALLNALNEDGQTPYDIALEEHPHNTALHNLLMLSDN